MEIFQFSNLNSFHQKLVNASIEATKLSYSPYSKFKVGTAIGLNNQEIVLGANQENASYPLCLCAERVALSHAVMRYPNEEIKSIAISTSAILSEEEVPAAPCGACRQVLLEYQMRQNHVFEILLVGQDKQTWIYKNIQELLPHSFDGKLLR